jgi:uncharacterized protein
MLLWRSGYVQASQDWRAPFAFACLIALTLAGCGVAPSRAPVSATPEQQAAEADRAARDGRHADASAAWEAAARGSPGDLRDRFLLRAADEALNAGDATRAGTLLAEVGGALPTTDFTLRATVAARLALANNHPDRALTELERIPRPVARDDAPLILALTAQAQFALGRATDGVNTLIERERYAHDRESIAQNNALMWSGLKSAARAGGDFRVPVGANEKLAGWLELGGAAAAAERNPFVAGTAFATWRARYAGHPGNQVLSEEILPALSAGLDYPAQVALVLPLSGRQQSAGLAVRDGFLAALLEQPVDTRPVVRIYDTAAIGTNTAYRRAIADAGQFVVGPLLKEEVRDVAASGDVAVPTLALNALPEGTAAPGLMYQFALDPEQEARQVAARIAANGLVRGVALVPDNEWGRRVHQAFVAEFTALGGTVVGTSFFDPATRDYSEPITRLLLIDESRARLNRLVRMLGTPLEFEPRPRADVEFVFVAAQPTQGRSLRPALRFHLAEDLPVYATSDIYDPDATGNTDLDGIIFPDMPWIISDDATTRQLRASVREYWPARARSRGRLYAFGFDAYRLIPLLRSSRPSSTPPVAGMTGVLSVGENGHIERQLEWARIGNGKVRALDAPALDLAATPP